MKNSAGANLINAGTLQLLRAQFAPYTVMSGRAQEKPLLVSGAFRYGTTITTRILSQAGFDPGPDKHLLQGNGPFGDLNPDGFLEHFFFIELSLYLFHKTNSWGDNPPTEETAKNISNEILSDDEFRKYTLMEIHDDRVSNLNKIDVLKKASIHHIPEYVSHEFGVKPLIKCPHFSVLEPYFQKVFPDSKRVVVFRSPDEWIRSSQPLTKKADASLYDAYYEWYIHNRNNAIFFDYDELLVRPERSISILLNEVGGPKNNLNELVALVRPTSQSMWSNSCGSKNYSRLKELATNR